MKQGLLLLGCLVAAVGCKQAPRLLGDHPRTSGHRYLSTGRRYADKSQCHRRTAGEERTDAVHHRPSAV